MQDIIELILLFIGLHVIIFFHEFGHLIFSKIVKFTCEEFQIGVGPRIFHKKHNGTKYSLKMIPIGGICTFKEFTKKHEPNDKVRGFYLRKTAVILGGPIINFILAFILMVCSFGNFEGLMITSVSDTQLNDTLITKGNIIRNINDERVFNINDIRDLLVPNSENTITFLNDKYEKKTISFYCTDTELNISFDESFENKVNGTVRTFGKYIELITESTGDLFSGDSSIVSETTNMSNPYSSMNSEFKVPQSALRDINKFMMITSIFSFCLGALNLLPIVVFDGFKAIVSLLSVLINREIPKKFAIVIAAVGVIISLLILF